MRYYIETSDKRNECLLRLLQQKGCDATGFGSKMEKTTALPTSKACQPCEFSLKKESTAYVFSPAKKILPASVIDLQDSSRLFGGNLATGSEGLSAAEIIRQKNITHVNFLADEVFAHKNALLTAEGVLALLLQSTPLSIFQNNILITGWGRCAKAVARLFDRLGLGFSVAVYNSSKQGECFLYSTNCYLKEDFLPELDRFDVIINTIPFKIFDEAMCAKIAKNALVIEVASVACLNAEQAQLCGFTYLPAPGLPQVFCCESAAGLMLEVLEKSC